MPACHIFHSPLPNVASPNDFCRVLITSVVGIAEPKWYQLNVHHGSTTTAAVSGATQNRRRRAGVARYTTATMMPKSGRVRTSRPATTPNAIRRPRTACAASPVRSAAVGTTSSPNAEFTNGLAKTTASTASDQTPETLMRRAICAAHTAMAADSTTIRRPRPSTGRIVPVTAVIQVATASSTTFNGDVAVFDSSAGIIPQCRCSATLRA